MRKRVFTAFAVLAVFGLTAGVALSYFAGIGPARGLLFRVAFYIALLVALFITAAGYVISGIFSKPIEKLREASEHIAEGDLDYGISVDSDDEIGILARSMRAMVDKIKDKQTELLLEKGYTDNIIASMMDTLIVIDEEGMIRAANKEALDLLGYTEEELIGRSAEMIFAGDEKKEMAESGETADVFRGSVFKRLLVEGAVRDADIIYRTKAGEDIPVNLCGAVMYEPQPEGIMPGPGAGERDIRGRRVIGVVAIARDMRRMKTLISDLRESKKELENLSLQLEEKIEERVKYLTETQEASLNVLEDLQKTTKELEASNLDLKKAKEEIEGFFSGLEEKVKERTMEMSILYEVSNAISYTLDYQQLIKLIMESLFKITEYDICAALLFDRDTANITVKPAYPECIKFVDRVKNNLIEDTDRLVGANIRKKRLTSFLIPTNPDIAQREDADFSEIRSCHNVPFVVRGETIGMINVSSCRESAFTGGEVRIIYTIANQASNAIERLQAVITAEKSKMESMVESMAEGVIMMDEQGEIVVLNPQGRRMLGFDPGEEVNAGVLNDKLKTVALDKTFEECGKEQQMIAREIIFPQRADQILKCETTAVKGEDGELVGILMVLRDITREKELAQMKSEFISTVSHELRTPLTTIKETVSQVLEGILGETTPGQREFLSICLEDANRLKRIIDNLLDISKIEAGKVELRKKLLDIVELAKNRRAAFLTQAQNKGLDISVKASADAIEVYADKDKMIQVFTNLIGNAMKFTVKGHIEILITDKGDTVECAVCDTGKGISDRDREKIFNKFQQVGRSDGPGEKGTGLGLSIAKGLIELHKGKIWVESKVGHGTKFIFTLPKGSIEEVLTEKIDMAVAAARTARKALSVFMVCLDNYPGIVEKYGRGKAEQIVKSITGAINMNLKMEEPAVVNDRSEVFVYAETGDDDRADMEAKLRKTVIDATFSADSEIDADCLYGFASFPMDGEFARALLIKARERAGKGKELRMDKEIMIVDDEPEIVFFMAGILKKTGYKNITEVYDGEGVFTKIKDSIPGMIILDMKMPRMNGYEVIGRLKGDVRTKDIPVLILSGYEIEIDKLKEYDKEKAIPMIHKPINVNLFIRWVRAILS
ncbi:MAG: ATP-binding protein [Candidatus Omnitrophota bacterium]